jgi:protein TonB
MESRIPIQPSNLLFFPSCFCRKAQALHYRHAPVWINNVFRETDTPSEKSNPRALLFILERSIRSHCSQRLQEVKGLTEPRRTAPGGLLFSLGAHAGLILCLLAAGVLVRHAVRVRTPGTKHGLPMMLYYTPGGAPAKTARNVSKPKPKPQPSRLQAPVEAAKLQPRPANQAASPQKLPSQTSAFGDGDIQMALLQFSPEPKPDLSSLPPGTQGDVVLDIVIDTRGKIAQIKLVKGLGGAVDQSVIAAAERWTFTPATRDGVPIESSQQLLFHYERS